MLIGNAGCAAHHAVFHIGDDDRAIARAFFGIALDEAVVQEAIEAIAPAFGIEPQQMIAQERQFLMLAEGPHIAEAWPRIESVLVWQV